MPDREKILRGAECCKYEHSQNGCPEECPYLPEEHLTCGLDPLLDDVIALLREQEPVEPHVEHDSDDDTWYYGCGACHEAIDYKDKFCRHCGREVKWDG